MQSLREVFNDAMTRKQIDGAKIDELLKRSDGEFEVTMDDMDDADIDWLETMDNPAAYGRASISTLPKWQKHDPQTYGFLNPKPREHSKAVCPRCRDVLDRDDAFTKVNPMSDTCVQVPRDR